MNIYALIILTTLLLDVLLNVTADLLNLKSLSTALPKEFQGIYDARDYQKSQEYTRTNTRFGFVTSAFNLAVTLLFWFTGGFNALDQIVRGLNLHPIWNGLIYIGALLLAKTLLSLPFGIYATFVIEEKFGFNKTTPRIFVLDQIKTLGLSLVLGGPLLAGVLAFFQYVGNLAWLYCWIVSVLFTLFIQFVGPTWIMPLFNKFKPVDDDALKKSILDYANRVDYSLSGVYVMDGSKRSTKSNAAFTGFGRNKRIILFDTLMEKHPIPEIVAILAHEIGHYKKKHIIKGMVISILHAGIVFYLLSIFLKNEGLFQAFYMEQRSIYAGLLFFGMLYAPVELILSIFMNIFSRKNEYEADRFVRDTTGKTEDIIHALKTLSVHNLSNLTPHPFYVFLNYSHPTLFQRIQRIRQFVKKAPANKN